MFYKDITKEDLPILFAKDTEFLIEYHNGLKSNLKSKYINGNFVVCEDLLEGDEIFLHLEDIHNSDITFKMTRVEQEIKMRYQEFLKIMNKGCIAILENNKKNFYHSLTDFIEVYGVNGVEIKYDTFSSEEFNPKVVMWKYESDGDEDILNIWVEVEG